MLDYSKNWALNQEKISNASVTIVGSESLTNYLSFYMAGLGLRKIRFVDCQNWLKRDNEFLNLKRSKFKVESLKQKLEIINPELKIEAIPFFPKSYFLGHPDILLDLTNNVSSKKICSDYFHHNPNIKRFISASTSQDSASIILQKEKGSIAKIIDNDFLEEYKYFEQGAYTSGIASAIILDEIRKIISPLDEDKKIIGRINFDLISKFTLNKLNPSKELNKPSKLLICGAGGIGTYVALNLMLENFSLEIFDGDRIESSNISRQIFYYNQIGKYKATTLRKRLKEIKSDSVIIALDDFLDADNIPNKKYDAIVCCADNWKARKVLNEYAIKTKTPLFNASVTPFSARAEAYIPGKNYCLDCKYNLEELIKQDHKQSCSEILESNVVMTNAFIGAFLCGEIKSFLNFNQTLLENIFEYNSKADMNKKFRVFKKNPRRTNCKCMK